MKDKTKNSLAPGLKLFFSRHSLGRVALHAGCICRGGQAGFHIAGIRREIWRIATLETWRRRDCE